MTFGYMKKLKWVIILLLLAAAAIAAIFILRNITRPSEQEFSGMFILIPFKTCLAEGSLALPHEAF